MPQKTVMISLMIDIQKAARPATKSNPLRESYQITTELRVE